MDRLTVASPSAFGFETTRTEIGMPSLVIRLRTLHPIFRSVRLVAQSPSVKTPTDYGLVTMQWRVSTNCGGWSRSCAARPGCVALRSLQDVSSRAVSWSPLGEPVVRGGMMTAASG